MLISLEELKIILSKNNIKVTGILHVGAHDCEELHIYKSFGISANDTVWIEALPHKVKEAQDRGIVNIYNAVITDRDDEDVVFHIANNGQSSSVLEFNTHSIEYPDVFYTSKMNTKSLKLDTFFERNGIDSLHLNFWNIDIQGCELLALKGAKDSLAHVSALYLEVNEKELYKGGALINELDEVLREYGIRQVWTTMNVHGWGEALYVKEKLERSTYLCYYSCFFGPTDSFSNVVRDVPSKKYDCYYFTNNQETYNSLKNSDWKRVFVPVTIKYDSNMDTLDSKLLKSCPHLVKELQVYDYSVYMDTRNVLLREDYVLDCIRCKTKPILMIPHRWWSQVQYAVLVEFFKSLEQERYFKEKEKIEEYINTQVTKGYSLNLPMHYETGFIVRNQKDDRVIKLNEAWYDEIIRCGIQCQVSFFFVQQMFPDIVDNLCDPLDPLIVIDQNTFESKLQVHKIKIEGGFTVWQLKSI